MTQNLPSLPKDLTFNSPSENIQLHFVYINSRKLFSFSFFGALPTFLKTQTWAKQLEGGNTCLS
jgi:hypothetical protein